MSFVVRVAYIGTYFLAQSGLKVGKNTLVEMQCISSIAWMNLVISTLSFAFISLLRQSYYTPVTVPIPVKGKVVTAILEIVHFMFMSESIVINTYSVHRFAMLLSIPYCLIHRRVFENQKLGVESKVALAVFCVGSCFISTDAFTISSQGLFVGLLYAIVNAQLSLFIGQEMARSGADAIVFQESVAGYRMVFSVVLTAVMTVFEREERFRLQMQVFPVCVITASAALDLAMTVSMVSLISLSSPLMFVVVVQLCELMMILIGRTLDPTRFATLKEAVMSFIGFGLAFPALIMFLALVATDADKPLDVEPFQVQESDLSEDSDISI